jgi:hypothetical protein
MYTIVVGLPTVAQKYTEISLYTRGHSACISEPCGHLHGRKIQKNVYVKRNIL